MNTFDETTRTDSMQDCSQGPASNEAGRLPGISRRSFLAGAGGVALLAGVGCLRYVGAEALCRPPGGQDEASLISACIRCERCYEVCPQHVIAPAHVEDGIVGVRTPVMNFSENFCDFCNEKNGGSPLCVRECPTGALALPEGATAQSTIIGLAVIDERSCLAYRDTGCRYCHDACTKTGMNAIYLEAGESYGAHPKVDAGKCNGCGACESVCVSLQSASVASGTAQVAIVVRPISCTEGMEAANA